MRRSTQFGDDLRAKLRLNDVFETQRRVDTRRITLRELRRPFPRNVL